MRIVGKVLAVIGLGLLAVALVLLPAVIFDDLVYDGWAGWLLFLAPFIGAGFGGWLVSRHSTRGRKIGWTLGGGLGLGLVSFVLTAYALALLLSRASDDSGGYYCC